MNLKLVHVHYIGLSTLRMLSLVPRTLRELVPTMADYHEHGWLFLGRVPYAATQVAPT